jgi:hypothetical protein
MKMIKIALLGTAAIAAVSMSARADDLADLKARIAALEANAASASVPAGYQLVSISKGKALQFGIDSDEDAPATLISVMPAADAPASTVVSINGNVKAAIVYSDHLDGTPADSSLDVDSKAGVTIAGKTDTAVGEVGAKVSLAFSYAENTDGSHDVGADGYWGYWAMTPELTLGGGRDGSLSGIGFGIGECTCNFTGNHDSGQGGNGDPSQLRLKYASGPMSFAIALEDGTRGGDAGAGVDTDADDDALGGAAEVKWSGDMMSVELAGGFWGDDDAASATNPNRNWQVGAGMGFNLSDMAAIQIATSTGESFANVSFWDASILAKGALSDSVRAEIGVGFVSNEGPSNDQTTVIAGIYYEPVSQLSIGVEADWNDVQAASDEITAALVTVYKF